MCAVRMVRAYRHTQLAYRHTQDILEDEGTVAGPLLTVCLRIPQTPGHVEEAGNHVDANEFMEPAFRVRPDTFHHATTISWKHRERASYIYIQDIHIYLIGCTESERASEARNRTTATPAQFWLSLGPVHVANLRTSQGYTRDRVESCGPDRGRTGASRHEAVWARSKA